MNSVEANRFIYCNTSARHICVRVNRTVVVRALGREEDPVHLQIANIKILYVVRLRTLQLNRRPIRVSRSTADPKYIESNFVVPTPDRTM